MNTHDALKLLADSSNFRKLTIDEAIEYPAASDFAYIAKIEVGERKYIIIADGDELKITDDLLNEHIYFLHKV